MYHLVVQSRNRPQYSFSELVAWARGVVWCSESLWGDPVLGWGVRRIEVHYRNTSRYSGNSRVRRKVYREWKEVIR